jgi:catechol 2,3-dioxygenase-like lactoylglutathione lyase family enzyme
MSVRRIVPDLHGGTPEENRAFYEDLVGLELQLDLGWIFTFASRDNPTAQLSVVAEDATAPIPPDVTIEVDDVDAVYERMVEHAREIVYELTDEAWGVRRFFVRDPNGAVVNVMAQPGG